MHLNIPSWFDVQDNRVYDFGTLEFLHGTIYSNLFLNTGKTEIPLDNYYKHEYE